MFKLEKLMEVAASVILLENEAFIRFVLQLFWAGLTRAKLRRNLQTKAIYGTHLFLFNNSASSLPH
jgi:hypothetical protein